MNNEILGDDVEEKTDNGGKIKSSDSTQSHPQKGKRKSNRKVWNGDSDSKKHSYKENSSEQREARPNSSIHDSNPSHDSDIPLTNSDLIGKKESMSMLQKEKETTIAAMGLLKRQIKKMKTDYPDKPRPQSIKLTIKGMKANLKEYKKNLKALIELEKEQIDDGSSDDSGNSILSTAQNTPTKSKKKSVLPKKKKDEEDDVQFRHLRKSELERIKTNSDEKRKKKKQEVGWLFGMCCGNNRLDDIDEVDED